MHYNDAIMSMMASQSTSLTIVYSTVYSRHRSKKTSKLRVIGLCKGNSPVTGEFPTQRASNMEKKFHLITSSISTVNVTHAVTQYGAKQLGPSHSLDQCWLIDNCTLRNKRDEIFHKNTKFSFNKMHRKKLFSKLHHFLLAYHVLTFTNWGPFY